jgi:tRNA G18 (ribose-2'-O)-methylase SpoU
MVNKRELFIILHDIRSAYNVGAVFRTADGAGAAGVYLTGYTPSPGSSRKIYKTKAEKMIEKTALGAEKSVFWERHGEIEVLFKKLREKKINIAALEQAENAVNIKRFKPKFPLALVLGNEIKGIPEKILKKCDKVVSIPMRGRKESLNVSVAAGIAMYEILS